MRSIHNFLFAVLCGAAVVSCVQDPEFEPKPTVEPANKIIGNADAALNGELIIYTTNITVSRQSTLTLQAPKVAMNPPFNIQSGSSLIITSLL